MSDAAGLSGAIVSGNATVLSDAAGLSDAAKSNCATGIIIIHERL